MAQREALHRSRFWRFCPSLAGISVYLLFVLLWFAAPHAYAALLWAADAMAQTPRPFNDLGAILQAGSCWRHGVNVYAPSACMHGGIYNYSPFLLHLMPRQGSPQVLLRRGVALGLVFLTTLCALPAARTRGELALRVLGTCSGSVIFALERGNFDVVIFILILLGVLLLRLKSSLALLGYAVFLFAASCKFYPAVLLALLLRERPARLLIVTICIAVAGLSYLTLFAHGTLAAAGVLPVGLPFKGIFGAADIPFGLILLHNMRIWTLQPDAAQYLTAIHHPGVIPLIRAASWALTLSGVAAGMRAAPLYAASLDRLDEARRLPLLAGAMLMVFCFFLVQNIPYRAIFLLLTLPGLTAMAATAKGQAKRNFSFLSKGCLILLWEDALRNLVAVTAHLALPPAMIFYPEFLFWLVSECLWWWVIIQFTALLMCFLRAAWARLRAERMVFS